MRNIRKISMVIIAVLAILLMIGGAVNAAGLTLKVSSDKKELKVGEEVTVTVDWTEKMGSADIILSYDKEKVEYKSSSISNNGILHEEENGTVEAVWASGEVFTKITFTFIAKAEGEAKFELTSAKDFATVPDLKKPDSYDIKTYGATAVTLKAANNTPTATSTPAPTQKPATVTPTPTAKAPTVLPKAGDGLNILAAIPVLLAVTVLAYVQIRKYKEI